MFGHAFATNRTLSIAATMLAVILSPILFSLFGYAILYHLLIFTTICLVIGAVGIPNEYLSRPLSPRAAALMNAWLLAGIAHLFLGLMLLFMNTASQMLEYAYLMGIFAIGCTFSALGLIPDKKAA